MPAYNAPESLKRCMKKRVAFIVPQRAAKLGAAGKENAVERCASQKSIHSKREG